MKYAILIVGMIFLMSSVSAVTFQQYTNSNLKIPFEVNGSIPSGSAWCKVTIEYPNSTSMKTNETMTNLGNGQFNITLTSGELVEVGEHSWVAFCCDAGRCAAGYDDFYVTPTGDTRGFGLFLIFILSSVGALLLAHLLDAEFMGFFSGLLFAITGVYSMIYGIGSLADTYTRAVALICIGVGMVLIITIAYNFTKTGGDDY